MSAARRLVLLLAGWLLIGAGIGLITLGRRW